MERRRTSAAITLFSDDALSVGTRDLDQDAAQHARVRRVDVGDSVRVLDGRGRIGAGTIRVLSRSRLEVEITGLTEVQPLAPLTVLVPVADRDRMLLAAEKCAELQVSVWQPVVFARSRSVTPRGEGEKFAAKVRARMRGALEQSGGAWMPDIRPEIDASDAWAVDPAATHRLLLDGTGASIASFSVGTKPCAVAIGPEGGLEDAERDTARAAGWQLASLGPTTLRFETAVIAAVAILRSHQGTAHGGA